MLYSDRLVDSHCHLDRLNLDQYDGCLDQALAAAREKGVEALLCVGIDLTHAAQVIQLAEQYSGVYASVGIHPLEKLPAPVDGASLLAYAGHERVVAIGETGLDYYYGADSALAQQALFALQLQTAGQAGLPVIVHSRDASEDTLALIRRHGSREHGGVLHCFCGDWDMARAAMDMNYMISISGMVTFASASALRDVVRKIPLDRLLIETDAPYLAPVPHRGKPNEPAFIAEVAAYIAQLRQISLSQLAQRTTENFFRLFPRAALQHKLL